MNREIACQVSRLNQQMLRSLEGLICFKEEILREVARCRLYTTNYPLLIEHILREAKLYRQMISELEQRGRITAPDLRNLEIFWNQIMMEHAQFIRGLLDPLHHSTPFGGSCTPRSQSLSAYSGAGTERQGLVRSY